MIDFTRDSLRTPTHVLSWYVFAFQAGAINAAGFLSCHSFVSHMTGIGTMFGIQMASANFLGMLELVAVPGSFLLGAIFSSLLIEQRRLSGKEPLYTLAMGIIFILLATVLVLGCLGWLGRFGEPFELGRDVFSVSLLCIACGLQNATVTSATAGAIRTTHLTGILSDYGVNLVRIRYLPVLSKERYWAILTNRSRLGTFLSFSVGSALSATLCVRFEYLGFALPTATSLIFVLLAHYFASTDNSLKDKLSSSAIHSSVAHKALGPQGFPGKRKNAARKKHAKAS